MHFIKSILGRVLLVIGLTAPLVARAEESTEAQGVEFFEKQIRPIFAEQCYSCHSRQAEKIKGGLLLDTREGLLKGGDTGPAIAPGAPNDSLLIKAVRYTDENLQMPPKNKRLSKAQVTALEHWIQAGAPMPGSSGLAKAGADRLGRKHWSFQPVIQPPIPAVDHQDLVQEPIDNFILVRVEAKGLVPSPKTDRRTLLRRAFFDVIGLPPTPEDVARFLADDSPAAFARVVDRLLASPQYGERWGRYWLDVARYADTKGYVFEEERRYPYAYTYRDYVIRAFNEDLPFDRFLIEQLAADQLPLGQDRRPLAALGYLTLGRRFLNNQPDIIDDRIDVVTRGMMGLTVACARCHDHKYDPIPTKDYYSLYGVFASCSEPEEKPMLGEKPSPHVYAEYQAEHDRRSRELNQFRAGKEAEVRSEVRQLTGAYLLASYDVAALPDPSKAEALARERKLDPATLQRWIHALNVKRRETFDPVLGLWLALASCAPEEFKAEAAAVLASWPAEVEADHLNPIIAQLFGTNVPSSMLEVADRYGGLLSDLDRVCQRELSKVSETATAASHPTNGGSTTQPPALPPRFDDPEFEQLRQVLYAADSPCAVPEGEITHLFDVPSIQKLRALKRQVEELDATHPGAPARAMALQDDPVPVKPHVFLRGNPSNPGPEIDRHFLTILSRGDPKPFEQGSGRLELARAIANRSNPLTARVLVNRVWLHYFGAGLVRTPSDFGLRSEPPSHPELLDYLASRFMQEGWSLKKLHRHILLSRTYQQASDDQRADAKIDPGNQLIWRMNRRRLDFEALRDSLLAVAGRIDLAEGGHSVDITVEPFTLRRTVYGFVERQNLPGLFRTFDFATPDTTSPQRFSTTVPQQALFMLNSPFVQDQASLLADRGAHELKASPEERIQSLYQTVFQRPPSTHEVDVALAFLNRQASLQPFTPEPEVWQYGYGEFDREARKLKDFHRFSEFVGAAWQPGAKDPDPELGRLHLKAAGGQPGKDHQHASVRRWIAPRDLTVAVSGKLRHDPEQGDGINAWISSSRAGELGGWTVYHSTEETRVEGISLKQGDTLDFIVDCRDDANADGYTWAPVIRDLHPDKDPHATDATSWDARQDFSGPKPALHPLDPWQRLAQVLLMSNEFVFLD